MTGLDIYKRCIALMGYTSTESDAVSDHTIIERFPEIINQVAADLKIEPIKSLTEIISATDAKTDALCYGAAMFLALSEGDGDKNQLFSSIYNAKRATALSSTDSISDVLPGLGAEGL